MRTSIGLALWLALSGFAGAQEKSTAQGATTQNPPASAVHRTAEANAARGRSPSKPGEVGSNPASASANSPSTYAHGGVKFTAQLLNVAEDAKNKTADVKVTVSGIQLIDPDSVRDQARNGQGHLHYRVDNGPVIATTATKLAFHELPHGKHRIVVELVANDHTPLGPHQVLDVDIP